MGKGDDEIFHVFGCHGWCGHTILSSRTIIPLLALAPVIQANSFSDYSKS